MKKSLLMFVLFIIAASLSSCFRTGLLYDTETVYIVRGAELLSVTNETFYGHNPFRDARMFYNYRRAQDVIDFGGVDPLAVELRNSRLGQIWPDAMFVASNGKIVYVSSAYIMDDTSFAVCKIIDGKLSIYYPDKVAYKKLSLKTKMQLKEGIQVSIE